MLYIQNNISLKDYNTFAVDAKADFFVEISTEKELFDLISSDVFATQQRLILGGGANILFTKDYKGLVIKISLMEKKVVKEEGNKVYLKIGAGENRHEFILRTLKNGYVGMENLVLIPGQVGAAPVGNIGAYGKEVQESIYEVEGVDRATNKKIIRTNSECKFAYRDSIFKHELKDKVIITAVTFVVEKESPGYIPDSKYHDIQQSISAEGLDPTTLSAQALAEIIIEIRNSKLPNLKEIGTAGSFFKNPIVSKDQFETLLLKYPELKGNAINNSTFNIQHLSSAKSKDSSLIKLSAGQLIELAGFKGKSEGAVGTYSKHALVIVNNGGASGQDIRAFAQSIQKKVLELFGVELEPEVIIL